MDQTPWRSCLRSGMLLLCLACGGAWAQTPYRLTVLDTIGVPTDINESGQVVFNRQVVFNTEGSVMVWNGTTITNLGPGQGLAINDLGQIAGFRVATGSPQATLWSDGTAALLGSSTFSLARDINNRGQIVGFELFGVPRATLWEGGATTYLGSGIADAISADGRIVGRSFVDDPSSIGRAALWSGGGVTFLDGIVSSAGDINDRGQIIGRSATGRATLWDGASTFDLGLQRATAINNAGQVVGTLDERAALWNGLAVTDLNSLLRPESVAAGWVLTAAEDINEQGWIVGTATNRSGGENHPFVLSISDLPDQLPGVPAPIPEPSTYALMLAGLGAIGVWAQRRRAASASR